MPETGLCQPPYQFQSRKASHDPYSCTNYRQVSTIYKNIPTYTSFLGLKTFAKCCTNKHIWLLIHNMSAVSIINNMGTSHSEDCHSLKVQIWECCIPRGIWISAAHIPGRDNCVADRELRQNDRTSEWMFNKEMLQRALDELDFSPDIDLFAS